MFSLYGIRNIGNSLEMWQKEFETLYSLISEDKRKKFPQKFVQFLGFTIYNAKKYANEHNSYDLANAHYSYVQRLPDVIKEKIKEKNREFLNEDEIQNPIGGISVMHTHNTFTSVAQALNCPLWDVPEVYMDMRRNKRQYLDEINLEVNQGSFGIYRDTKQKYIDFANDLLKRIEKLDS